MQFNKKNNNLTSKRGWSILRSDASPDMSDTPGSPIEEEFAYSRAQFLGRTTKPIDNPDLYETVLSKEERTAAKYNETVTKRTKCIYFSLNSFAQLTSFGDSAVFLDGLSDIPGKLCGYVPRSSGLDWTLSGLYLGQSITVNNKWNDDGLREIAARLRGRSHPNEWTKLPTTLSKIGFGVSTLLISGSAFFTDTFAYGYGYDQIKAFHMGKPLSILFGFFTALSNIPTEHLEMVRAMRKLFGTRNHEASGDSCLNRTLKDFVKKPLQVLTAVDTALESYIFMAAMLETDSPVVQWILLVLAAKRSINNFFFDGKNGGDALIQFYQGLKNFFHHPKLLEPLVLLIEFYIASLITDVQRNFTYSTLDNPDASLPSPLPKKIPDSLNTIISWGSGLQAGVLYVYYFHPTAMVLINSIKNCCCKKQKTTEDLLLEDAEQSDDEENTYSPPKLASKLESIDVQPQSSTDHDLLARLGDENLISYTLPSAPQQVIILEKKSSWSLRSCISQAFFCCKRKKPRIENIEFEPHNPPINPKFSS